MEIKIVKSWRRRKTASARLKNGVLYIRLPAFLPPTEVQKIIDKFRKSIKQKASFQNVISDDQLAKRAARLNQRYFEGKLKYHCIRWSTRQNSLHGSCSTRKKTIRISIKLAKAPKWILDAIIVHELTHLLVPSHGKRFWQIANRYPLMERSRGYLQALGKEK